MKKFKTYLAESFEPKKITYGSMPNVTDNMFTKINKAGLTGYIAYFKYKDEWFRFQLKVDGGGMVALGFGIQTKENPTATDFSDERKHVKMNFLRLLNHIVYLITEVIRVAGNMRKIIFTGKDSQRYNIYKKMVDTPSFRKMLAKYKYKVEENTDPGYEFITIRYVGDEKNTMYADKIESTWMLPFTEQWISTQKIKWSGKSVDVYYNPSRKEISQNRTEYFSAYLDISGNMYSWVDALHINIQEGIKEIDKTAIPILVWFNGKKADVVVTDSTKRSMWHHNKEVANIIKNHRHMKKLFSNIEVSYYDEAIVGDWEKL